MNSSHELARLMLSAEDKPVTCSVDISTCEEDSTRRVFGEYIEINDLNAPEITLLCIGAIND